MQREAQDSVSLRQQIGQGRDRFGINWMIISEKALAAMRMD